jgi:hypothetical protein
MLKKILLLVVLLCANHVFSAEPQKKKVLILFTSRSNFNEDLEKKLKKIIGNPSVIYTSHVYNEELVNKNSNVVQDLLRRNDFVLFCFEPTKGQFVNKLDSLVRILQPLKNFSNKACVLLNDTDKKNSNESAKAEVLKDIFPDPYFMDYNRTEMVDRTNNFREWLNQKLSEAQAPQSLVQETIQQTQAAAPTQVAAPVAENTETEESQTQAPTTVLTAHENQQQREPTSAAPSEEQVEELAQAVPAVGNTETKISQAQTSTTVLTAHENLQQPMSTSTAPTEEQVRVPVQAVPAVENIGTEESQTQTTTATTAHENQQQSSAAPMAPKRSSKNKNWISQLGNFLFGKSKKTTILTSVKSNYGEDKQGKEINNDISAFRRALQKQCMTCSRMLYNVFFRSLGIGTLTGLACSAVTYFLCGCRARQIVPAGALCGIGTGVLSEWYLKRRHRYSAFAWQSVATGKILIEKCKNLSKEEVKKIFDEEGAEGWRKYGVGGLRELKRLRARIPQS